MIERKWKLKIKKMIAVLIAGVVLMLVKFTAYFITHSNAILTDALESIINVVAGSFALYSLYYSSQPKDSNHPYGHGKIEYLASGFEGSLIGISGILIGVKSVQNFFYPAELHALDIGVYLTLFAGLCNLFMGIGLVKEGKNTNSTILLADGKHLLTDAISSGGIVLGLLIIYFTKMVWLDNVIALLAGCYICYTGFRLIKESVTHLLDEADYVKLNSLISILNMKRREKWIDIHNLRVLKYGTHIHVDAHITLPWYDNLELSHHEVSLVENLIKDELGDDVEFFIHADPCLPISCPICTVQNCPMRKAEFVKKLDWTLQNMLPDRKHQL